MQEIDLFKYSLFDGDQMIIFDYLSKPPFNINNKNVDLKYNKFEKNQVNFGIVEKNDIDKVYNSYEKIIKKNNLSDKDVKLLKLINLK